MGCLVNAKALVSGKRSSLLSQLIGDHSENTFVMQGGGASLKSELKQTRGKGMGAGGGSNLSLRSLCEKNWLLFEQQAEFFLIGCLAVPKCVLF